MDNQVEDKRYHADDNRAPEGTPRPLDEKAYTNLQADPGGEPQQERIDHQHEKPNGENDKTAGKKLKDWPDEYIDQPQHSCHDCKRQPGR